MNWIRNNAIAFERGGVALTLTRKQAMDAGVKFPESVSEMIAPQELEDKLRVLVETHRPELKGCMFWAMEFKPSRMMWTLIVEHGSLPKVHIFEELPVMPLIPFRMTCEAKEETVELLGPILIPKRD